MLYELMGRLHAGAYAATQRMRGGQRGQGTVEYVGLVLLLAVVLAGVVIAAESLGDKETIPEAVINKLEKAIDNVNLPDK